MDLKKLTSTLLSSDSIKGLSGLTGASKGEVSSVLTEALPALLSGANGQAKDSGTAKGFAEALAQHAKDDTGNLAGFLGKVDLGDGAKIIGHLLGSDKDSLTKTVAKKTGVSSSKIGNILSAVAPLLMSLLGQQADADEEKESGVGALLGNLLDNVDVGSLLAGLTSTDTSSSTGTGKKKKKKTAKKDSDSTASGLMGLLGKLLK
ncbi:MAG: DUF937 domain-containing protein [Lachnospiraceae bacterium]|nr:DUF937 domain-containing protein [Lachnospiraceae bacterium]